MMARSTHDRMQARADEEDAGAVAVLVLTVLAAIVSLWAIGVELQGFKDVAAYRDRTLRLALSGVTILSSWLFVQTIFAVHYAHDYFARGFSFPVPTSPRIIGISCISP